MILLRTILPLVIICLSSKILLSVQSEKYGLDHFDQMDLDTSTALQLIKTLKEKLSLGELPDSSIMSISNAIETFRESKTTDYANLVDAILLRAEMYLKTNQFELCKTDLDEIKRLNPVQEREIEYLKMYGALYLNSCLLYTSPSPRD